MGSKLCYPSKQNANFLLVMVCHSLGVLQ
uniref:Uncharacterized protein n=1 Tax=Rhizophora mucronata TaxID=61149 RepID=A0A2P2QSS9_RHIMU